MSVGLSLVVILFCLLSGAFFAGIETGLISINRLRLRHLVRRNVTGARTVQRFVSRPDLLLGTTLIGTNLSYVAASIVVANLGNRALGERWSWMASLALTLTVRVWIWRYDLA